MIQLADGTERRLRELAQELGKPAEIVLDEALDVYRRQHFVAAVDSAYCALWADPIAREEELAERVILEGTLGMDWTRNSGVACTRRTLAG